MFMVYDGPTRRFDRAVRSPCPQFQARHERRNLKIKTRLETQTSYYPCSDESSPILDTITSSTDDDGGNTSDSDPETPPEESNYEFSNPIISDDSNITHEPQYEYTAQKVSFPYEDMCFGGCKTDPFWSYPIKAQEYFPQCVEFCIETVSPTHSYFQYLMQHDVLFEAIITYSLCVMPPSRQSSTMRMALMQHYGSTLAKINERLSDPLRCSDDSVILAIANLIVICVSRAAETLGTNAEPY